MSHVHFTVKRLVVKVGASVLTDAKGRPDPAHLARLVAQVAACVAERCEVILVSSGAIACGMASLRLTRRPTALAKLQACAAIGQGQLMGLYTQAFAAHRLTVAQVLLTQADLAHHTRARNARNTLTALLAHQVVPIVNENDTVAVEEITFGDNDRLAALVASLLRADLLILLSDVDGLLHHGKVIERIDDLNHTHEAMVLPAVRHTTKGGMASKLVAGRIARHAGIPMVIANGHREGVVRAILGGQPVGTLIVPPTRRLTSRHWWIAFRDQLVLTKALT